MILRRKSILYCMVPLLLCLWLVSPIHAVNDELILALKGEPDEGFDPVMGWGRYGNPLFQSTLLARDNDLNIIHDLAESYTVDPDGLTWRVILRKDAKFSSGQPLTAEDVFFTFNKASQTGGKADLTALKSVEATGDFSIVFRLKKPDSTFINRLITLGIVPKHAYGPDYGRNPLGSGPYVLKSWVQGEQMIAEANPLYYAKKPFFKRLVFLYGEEDTMFAAAKASKVDMVVVPAHLAVQKIKGMTAHSVQSVDNRGIMFPMVPDDGKVTDNGAPIGNNVTSDLAIRKAVNLAVDRNALVQGVLEGFGRPAYFVCDNLPWDNPVNRFEDSDPATAKKLLAEAGWKNANNDGVLEKDGLKARFNLVYPAGNSVRQGLALAVADMLKPIGIEVAVEGKSWDEIKQKMNSDAILFGWGSHDPMEVYHLYHSRLAGQGWYNTGYYANAKVDGYLDQAVGSPNYEASLQFWKKAQWDGKTGCGPKGDAPWAWLVNLDHVYFVRDDLDIGQSRIEPHGHGWPITANITEWTRK
jgi:peptide/nickel transport system substrate-binding protein